MKIHHEMQLDLVQLAVDLEFVVRLKAHPVCKITLDLTQNAN